MQTKPRILRSFFCLPVLTISLLTSCSEDASKPINGIPQAPTGKIVLITGNGQQIIKGSASIPDAPLSIPTGLAATNDGGLLILVNGDGGTLIRLAPNGHVEPYAYHLEKRNSGDSDIKFDTSHVQQKGWTRQQDSSSMIRRANGDLWIYANTWIAAISSTGEAKLMGRLSLQESHRSDYQTRLFNDSGNKVLLINKEKLYEVSPQLGLSPYKLPEDIKNRPLSAVAAIGDGLAIGSRDEIYRVANGKVQQEYALSRSIDSSAGDIVSIISDEHDGYFSGTSAGLIFHSKPDGSTTLLAGAHHEPTPAIGGTENCPPENTVNLTTEPMEIILGYPESMLLRGNQLYVADAQCGRLYAIGTSTA